MDYHYPVLGREVLDILGELGGKTIVDATLGNGGHSLLMLEKGASVIGIEADPVNIQIATERIEKAGYLNNFKVIKGNFANIENIIKEKVDGVIFDLGLSSNQLKTAGRGFSFSDEQSLDMRVDTINQKITAEEIINTWEFKDLYEIFTKYAQEKYSKPLILRIINERRKKPIKSGERLGNIISDFYKERHLRSSVNPATKIFMALRIEVNQEFDNLREGLKGAEVVVKSGGTVVIISFHSGEDRIVKQFIRKLSIKSETIKPGRNEIRENPLSRSAVLRSFRVN